MINNYSFNYVDKDKAVNYAFQVDDDQRHDYVVREFLQFLSSIYGYDLSEKYLDDSSCNS